MVYVVDGERHAGYPSSTHTASGAFTRSTTQFRHVLSADEVAAARAGRYVLVASEACP
eukprot:CAMPEP_0198347116 /NCGR_PEP_ID=MMETSP1450-20131203/83152_1 /TAXON_ID=753684 ORGANISM="Madagascaria erythrocladiodes, Strain CCMP3234" /NCGR_SAMPLE_ID=MMETSP1450 /ASSEMBLY_ACC=CAM_ASM_001115 /LENGTH=57 /DNA_ID=CAMNT_0044052607 /DNA_START=30 /DNA_END=199 /DNA_ORIENTATION=+